MNLNTLLRHGVFEDAEMIALVANKLAEPDEIVSVLKNGVQVIVKRVPSPVVAVRGYVHAGGIYEGQWLGGGLSHLLEHLVAGGSSESSGARYAADWAPM